MQDRIGIPPNRLDQFYPVGIYENINGQPRLIMFKRSNCTVYYDKRNNLSDGKLTLIRALTPCCERLIN